MAEISANEMRQAILLLRAADADKRAERFRDALEEIEAGNGCHGDCDAHCRLIARRALE